MNRQAIGEHSPERTSLDIVGDWYATLDPALLSEEIEWRVLDSFPAGGLYKGRAAVLERFFPAVKARFASYETRPDRFMADGETVVVTGSYLVGGRGGRHVEAAFAHVWTLRGGTIAAFRQIADTATINAAWD